MENAIRGLDHLVLTVRELQATLAFYTGVMGMQAEVFEGADGTRRTALRFGTQKINLHVAEAEFDPRAERPTPGSADLCFLTDRPLTDWQRI
jgi:Lactoylglutathione lyase and related lyases